MEAPIVVEKNLVYVQLFSYFVQHLYSFLHASSRENDPLKIGHLLVDELLSIKNEPDYLQLGLKYETNAGFKLISWSIDWLIQLRNHAIHRPNKSFPPELMWNIQNHVQCSFSRTLTEMQFPKNIIEDSVKIEKFLTSILSETTKEISTFSKTEPGQLRSRMEDNDFIFHPR